MPVLVGTSGWQYADWRYRFFNGVPQRRWFEHTLAHFVTVELNVSFYRLPKREVFAGWLARSPDDAIITVKASRYITHVKRLRHTGPSVELLMERASALGPKLGPILIQLPPDLTVDLEGLAATLDAFPPGARLAVEPRNASWWTEDVRRLLESRGAALVWADVGEQPVSPLWRTAAFGYVRLHGGSAHVWPYYNDWALRSWAERLAATYDDSDDAFVYFNNDGLGAAVEDAATFARQVRDVGRTVSRVPGG
jgi:uncharacterized protein YecE (DUF72 family)